MTIYDSKYFVMNRRLCTLIGLWPYHRLRHLTGTIITLIIIVTTSSFALAMLRKRKDVDKVMLNALAILTMTAEMFKIRGLMAAEANMRKLLDSLEENWRIINNEAERKILIDYAKTGRLVTILYTSAMFSFGISIAAMPGTPKVLDIIFPLEEKRKPAYLLESEIFIDRESHFWLVFCFDATCTMTAAYVTSAADTMYTVVGQQCCALYAIVSYRLKQLGPLGSDISSDSAVDGVDSYKFFIETMQFHQTALTFTEILSDAYSLSFLFILLGNVILIPLAVCAMFAGAGSVLTIAFATFLLSVMLHLFIIVNVSQQIISHGEAVLKDSCDNNWYSTSQKTKFALLIFMQRCMQPSALVAGGLMVINYETYAVILKSSISYITVLLSFR